MCSTILARRGRVNVRHVRRDGDASERTRARPYRRAVDGPDVHPRVITTALAPLAAVLAAQDAAFLPKRGQQPCGLGHFCTGGAGRAARGLERSPLAGVEVRPRGAGTRAGAPTPPPGVTATPQAQDATLGACSTPPRRAPQHRLPASGAAHAVDGYWAQKTARAAVVALRRHPLTTRRGAAEGRFLCTGPQPTRRGAPRMDDGKGHWQAVRRCVALGTLAEAAPGPLDPAVGWHVPRPRKRRVGVLSQRQAPATPRDSVLAATARALGGHQRLEWDRARVQLEWVGRDRTPGIGRADGQARAAAALSGPGQATLATRKLGRAEERHAQSGEAPPVVSRARAQQRPGHDRWLD